MSDLYIYLDATVLEFTSPVCNIITTTDANQMEDIHLKFGSSCFSRFYPCVYYKYAYALDIFTLRALQVKR
jgi:hypothetical protein